MIKNERVNINKEENNMKENSLVFNAFINVLRQIISLFVPFIVFPYLSRMIGTANFGIVSYVSAFVGYFSLFAGFGINTYAIREGAAIRDNTTSVKKLLGELVGIGIITTIIAIILLIVVTYSSEDYYKYRQLVFIFLWNIPFSIIGIEWIYNIYEDFKYITYRTIFFQTLYVILIFIFVKDSSDYLNYPLITVCIAGITSLFNLVYSRKYVKIKPIFSRDCIRHLKPLLMMFANDLTILIYVNSDILVLGHFCNKTEVGLYSVASHLYLIIKKLLYSIGTVSLPRMTNYLNRGELKKYEECVNNVFYTVLMILIPSTVGLFAISKNVIYIVSGVEYIKAYNTLRILCIALLFAVIASILTAIVILPYKKEKYLLLATTLGAIVNLFLNWIIIPIYGRNAAALTTVISEGIACIVLFYAARKSVRILVSKRNLLSILIGCTAIVFCCLFFNHNIKNPIGSVICSLFVSAFFYFSILYLLNNSIAKIMLIKVANKFIREKK